MDDWNEGDEANELPASPQSDEQAQAAPTAGERLLYALGHLYRRSRRAGLDVQPRDFDIEDLARTIGVWRQVEFVQEDATGRHYHFGAEVLHADPTQSFPWRLRTDWEWAALRELDDFWDEWSA
jgi:hypothetical protein